MNVIRLQLLLSRQHRRTTIEELVQHDGILPTGSIYAHAWFAADYLAQNFRTIAL